MPEVVRGDGYAVAESLDALGAGYGFRKVRKELDVTAFGANVITIPPGYETGRHWHDEQEELYFVHRGAIAMRFDEGDEIEVREGGAARVDPSTVRSVRNLSDSQDAVYLVVGGKDGYVGRDGRQPEDETRR
ncbi:MAG TPA: cupin domain-containing protein [Solirubrobacterales bacterium]|nr:cupin domain-containing protein [Solirubrobacterales bacterium]